MALLGDLMLALERYDTYPAEDALAAVMTASAEPAWSPGLMGAMWHEMSAAAKADLTAWAAARLERWHALKANALSSAWENDPGPETEHAARCDAIMRAILIDLKSGLAQHPEIRPDALALQEMSQAGHAFAWSQAYRDLKADNQDFDLAVDSPDLLLYCQLSTHAFRWLTTDASNQIG
jgi:hypothetical protein